MFVVDKVRFVALPPVLAQRVLDDAHLGCSACGEVQCGEVHCYEYMTHKYMRYNTICKVAKIRED